MQVAGSVADLKVVILKCLEPPSQVPLRLAETQQPAEGGMICTQQKSSFIDVGPDMADAQNYHQQLSGGCSNSFPAEVGDHLLTVLPLLGELVWLAMDTSRAFLPFIWARSLVIVIIIILLHHIYTALFKGLKDALHTQKINSVIKTFYKLKRKE